MESLKKDVAAADKAIAGLGREGRALLAAVERTGASLRSLPATSLNEAAYLFIDNAFELPLHASLHRMFNFRVHEGVHACQFRTIPEYVKAVRNMDDMADDPAKRAVPAPETMLAVIDLIESKAHAVQAYFNICAARHYRDPRFVTCMKLPTLPPGFAALQEKDLAAGRDAAATARDVALTLLEMDYDDGDNMQDVYHALYLESYLEYVMSCPGPVLEKIRLYELGAAEERALVHAGGTLGFEGEMLQKWRKPRLSLENARRLLDIRACLPAPR